MNVGVFGAGAIGGSLGIKLSAVGVPVAMVIRPSWDAPRENLVVRDLQGHAFRPGDDLRLDADPAVLGDADVCLVAVKSQHTEEAGRALAGVLPEHTVVVSFQNGLRNPDRLRRLLPHQTVVGGMVSYNVVRTTSAQFRQATSGPLVVGTALGSAAAHLQALQRAFDRAGESMILRSDIVDVQAGKLLLNLNNGVCAVTGLTIAESVRSRVLRKCLSRLILEGKRVLEGAGLRPRAVVGLSPGWIARLLPLPDAIVLRAARSIVSIDPEARSSTLQDLLRGRPTEIDDLCGEIVHVAVEHGGSAPLNQVIVDAVRQLERSSPPLPFWSPERLHAAMDQADA
jgi:2-dehydropantoate 2-reductase